VVTDDCDIVDDLPETLHVLTVGATNGSPTRTGSNTARPLERCHENNRWRTGVSGLASYTVPKIDVLISSTFQNQPGTQMNANANMCGILSVGCTGITSSLGRDYTGNPGGRFFNIVPAGEVFIERLNQIDFRVAKLFRVGTSRTSINFDFYNIMNSNSVLTENPTYGTNWRTPQSILLPRLFKIAAQFDF
jgi:hypothetical protein